MTKLTEFLGKKKTMSLRHKAILTIFIVIIASAFICTSISRPLSCQEIHLGDSHATVKMRFPNLNDGLHSIKHDTLSEGRATDRWVTTLFYDGDDRVHAKRLEYRLGTRENYLIIHVADEGR